MQHGGLGSYLIVFLAACGEASHSSAEAAAGGSGGSAGRAASGATLGIGGKQVLGAGGSASGSSGESGGSSIAGTAPVACETEPGVPLLRPGCPVTEPQASDCPYEGLKCLYAGETSECFVEWECYLRLWSPRGVACRSEEPEPDPANPAGCTSYFPVDGEPCEGSELACHYGFCSLGGYRLLHATCTCGRFRHEPSGCPTVP